MELEGNAWKGNVSSEGCQGGLEHSTGGQALDEAPGETTGSSLEQMKEIVL